MDVRPFDIITDRIEDKRIVPVKDAASKYNRGNMTLADCPQAHDKTQAAFVQMALIRVEDN